MLSGVEARSNISVMLSGVEAPVYPSTPLRVTKIIYRSE